MQRGLCGRPPSPLPITGPNVLSNGIHPFDRPLSKRVAFDEAAVSALSMDTMRSF